MAELIKKWGREYQNSLKNKNAHVEGIFHLSFFRPLAFIIVKLVYPLPITPNQISIISMITAIVGGIFFSFGNEASFFFGGILYGLSYVLDNVDGMIARLKKNGTPLGIIVDGFVDYVSGIATYIGLAIGLSKADFPLPISPWILVLVTMISHMFHSMICDYYRREFLAHSMGQSKCTRREKNFFQRRLWQLKKKRGHYIEKGLILFYFLYSGFQLSLTRRKRLYDQETFYRKNRFVMFLWSLIDASAHIFILMITAMIFRPGLYLIYVLVVANLMVLFLWAFQSWNNKKILIKKVE